MKKNIPDYLKTARECAKEWGISQRRAQIYCGESRVESAFNMNNIS